MKSIGAILKSLSAHMYVCNIIVFCEKDGEVGEESVQNSNFMFTSDLLTPHSGVARHRKVGGHKLFFRKVKSKKKKKSQRRKSAR